jgi:hypothetical protein
MTSPSALAFSLQAPFLVPLGSFGKRLGALYPFGGSRLGGIIPILVFEEPVAVRDTDAFPLCLPRGVG